MKRRFAVLFLALFAFLVPQAANARWVQREVRWQLSQQGPGGGGTGIWVRDTSYTVLAVGTGSPADTTNEFSIDEADPIPRGVVAPGIPEVNGIPTAMYAYNSDTTVVAFLVFQSDSTAAPTATLSSLTVMIDGKAGGYGATTTLARGWVKADSALVNGAAGGTLIVGDESVSVPIRSVSPYGNVQRWQTLRARIPTATGILSACRVFVRYWRDN